VEATVTRWAESRLGVSAEFARSVPRLGGVVNGYANPQQLGVDRWLGIIAGYHEVGSVVHVIDCGSAITADLVDRGGVHRGGYISPGVAMMTQSLLHGTDRVRFASRSQIREATPGKDTSEAVAHGALLAACGFVSQACGRFNEISGDAVVLLTGGDAELIQRTLGLRANLRPSLVLDGLALALP
jgi:type III pantothenate kinase